MSTPSDWPRQQDCESIPRSGTIRTETPEERSYWAGAFHVSERVLLKAVAMVGRSIEQLRKLFCRD